MWSRADRPAHCPREESCEPGLPGPEWGLIVTLSPSISPCCMAAGSCVSRRHTRWGSWEARERSVRSSAEPLGSGALGWKAPGCQSHGAQARSLLALLQGRRGLSLTVREICPGSPGVRSQHMTIIISLNAAFQHWAGGAPILTPAF